MSRNLDYETEQKILDELDYLNGKEDFLREDYVWCRKIINKLLLELHYMRNEIINKTNT